MLSTNRGSSLIPFPKSIDISITGRCNLRCQYCFYSLEMSRTKDLPLSHWLQFFRELSRLGVFKVTLSGGELFVREDAFNIIDGVVDNRMRYSILSNGTLIDETLLKQFQIGKRRMRLDYIQISIDGASAAIHDLSRPNSFERAIHGVKILKEADFPVTVRVTINKHNFGELERICDLLLNQIGIPEISTNEAAPIGAGCANRDQLSLSAEMQAQVQHLFIQLEQKYPGRIKSQAGPQTKQRMYQLMEKAKRGGEKTSEWKMGYLSGCSSAFAKLDVLHDGTIVPCSLLWDLKLGNIVNDSVEQIWNTHPILLQLRNRSGIPMKEVPGCQDCEWNEFCSGSCPGISYQLTGSLFRANTEDCYRKFQVEQKHTHART